MRVAPIFTYRANEEVSDAEDYVPSGEGDYGVAAEPPSVYGVSHSREKLDAMMADYNALYGTSFSTKDKGFDCFKFGQAHQGPRKARLRRPRRGGHPPCGEHVLDGLRRQEDQHDVRGQEPALPRTHPAFSRTNRILNEKKSQGNIVSFRNLKESTDEAITLYSNKDALEVVLMPTTTRWR